MTSAQIIIVVTIVAYLFAMLLIGVIFNRAGAADTSDGFYIGGRSLGPLVTAMSAEASDMSSYLLMGLPGLAYLAGVAEVGWTAIGLAVGTYLNFLFVARRLRRYSEKLGAFTIPDFYSRRYNDRENTLSLIAALIIIIFFVPYTASGFKAVGTLFNSLFGIEYHMAMIIGAVIIVAYTTMGGFLAVSTTDLIQSIFMTIALIIIVFFGIEKAGGMDVVMQNAKELPGYLNITQGYDVASNSASSYGFLSVVSTLAWGLGYFGMPHILLRFMAIRNEKELVISRRIASVWAAVSMCIAIFIGIIGYSVSVAGHIPMLNGSSAESETIIIQMANLMSYLRSGGRRHPGRYPGGNHVHSGLPASCSLIECFRGPHAGIRTHQAYPAGQDDRSPCNSYRHRSCCHHPGMESQQLRLPCSLLRMGRIRRNLRSHHAAGPLLAQIQPQGRHGRPDLRRRHDLCVEVRHCPSGRRFRDLRAAPCIHHRSCR